MVYARICVNNRAIAQRHGKHQLESMDFDPVHDPYCHGVIAQSVFWLFVNRIQ